MRLAELLHLARGQGHQLVDRQIELRAPDHSFAVRRDLQDHELCAASGADATEPMRRPKIQQLRACRSNVLENRHSVDVGRRRERKRLAVARASRRRRSGPRRSKAAVFSPPSLAAGLKEPPSFVAVSAPANASVENAIRPTPAAKEDNLGMRFTLHVIHE